MVLRYGKGDSDKVSGDIGTMDVSSPGVHIRHCKTSCTISDNIETNINSAQAIPQVIIISDGDINIANTVTRIDAWLVAKGNVNTCKDYVVGEGDFAADRCASRLTINGPVYAGNVNLLRTFGANKNDQDKNGEPANTLAEEAERINLPGSSIIFAGKEATSSEPNTTYLKKIPTRY